mmetsp:Transcript_96171/g.170711  ORF Transcript_96171/g.170711 Transcript_96171/m.170711 type:complete len:247 (+) Transcript_96171:4926-5666(+)
MRPWLFQHQLRGGRRTPRKSYRRRKSKCRHYRMCLTEPGRRLCLQGLSAGRMGMRHAVLRLKDVRVRAQRDRSPGHLRSGLHLERILKMTTCIIGTTTCPHGQQASRRLSKIWRLRRFRPRRRTPSTDLLLRLQHQRNLLRQLPVQPTRFPRCHVYQLQEVLRRIRESLHLKKVLAMQGRFLHRGTCPGRERRLIPGSRWQLLKAFRCVDLSHQREEAITSPVKHSLPAKGAGRMLLPMTHFSSCI